MDLHAAPLPIRVPRTYHDRRHEREALRLRATFQSDDDALPLDALITDIAPSGCRIECASQAVCGAHATIIMRPSVLVSGRVAWSQDGLLGIDFAGPLLPRMLTLALNRADGA